MTKNLTKYVVQINHSGWQNSEMTETQFLGKDSFGKQCSSLRWPSCINIFI
jgi:hypothetical protein